MAKFTIGNIYGRGAIDDKGPVIASLYAMKAIMDTYKINKRVRLILGLNEEKDWKCINYYKEHEESPTFGFSPDADFPGIYAEKGVLSCYIISDYTTSNDIYISNIDCNNNPLNVVPKICSITLKINQSNILMSDFITILKSIIEKNNFEIDIYKINDEELKLTSYGIQAHAAHPDLGVNAISRLVIVLNQLFKTYDCNIPLFDFFDSYINTEYDGKTLGIDFQDESGSLTLNVGNFLLENNKLKIGMNLRISVHTDVKVIEDCFKTKISLYDNLSYETSNYMPPLYVEKNSFIVSTLCNIYNETTNQHVEPIAIGGATYARAFPNCISFGANLPGNKDMCHQTDEFISIDNLMLASKIYAKAIISL